MEQKYRTNKIELPEPSHCDQTSADPEEYRVKSTPKSQERYSCKATAKANGWTAHER
jgi:hypothetical protein